MKEFAVGDRVEVRIVDVSLMEFGRIYEDDETPWFWAKGTIEGIDLETPSAHWMVAIDGGTITAWVAAIDLKHLSDW